MLKRVGLWSWVHLHKKCEGNLLGGRSGLKRGWSLLKRVGLCSWVVKRSGGCLQRGWFMLKRVGQRFIYMKMCREASEEEKRLS